MIQTLEEAEKWFDVKAFISARIKFFKERLLNDKLKLNDKQKSFTENTIFELDQLLSPEVTKKQRILFIIKHIQWKREIVSFSVVGDYEDVIIASKERDLKNSEAEWS